MKLRLIVVTFAAVALLAAGGCSKGGPKMVRVSGTVKFKDGTFIPLPEPGAKTSPPVINFAPVGESVPGQPRKAAAGSIDANGHFDVWTIKQGDGIIPGKYVATIKAFKTYGDPKSTLVPEKYTSVKDSGLEYEFQSSKTDLEIVLDNK